MRDAMTSDSAVFEPDEIKVLDAAFREAARRLGDKLLGSTERTAELALIVHNLGRSRLQLKKALRGANDAHSLADEATELFDYLLEAPAALVEEGRRQGAVKPRDVTIFPTALRQLPTTALRHH